MYKRKQKGRISCRPELIIRLSVGTRRQIILLQLAIRHFYIHIYCIAAVAAAAALYGWKSDNEWTRLYYDKFTAGQ